VPPYALFVISFFIAALGQAFQDAQANTFVSPVSASHLFLGLIHAMYGLGLLIASLIATAIASNRPEKWATYYAFLLGLGVLNVLLVLGAFFFYQFSREEHQPHNMSLSKKLHLKPLQLVPKTEANPSSRWRQKKCLRLSSSSPFG
jgi:MFS family permease